MGKIKLLILTSLIQSTLFGLSITDVLDRKVSLEKPVERIIALGTSLSYITYLDSVDKVVGIESIELKDVEKRTYTYVNKERVKTLPIVGQGGKAKRPNLEAIISLRPDVIFMISQDKSEADMLSKQLNIPVVVVGYGSNTIDFKTVYRSLALTGEILGKTKRAEELIAYIKNLQKQFIKPSKEKSAFVGALAYKGLRGITSTQSDFMPFRLGFIKNIASNIQNSGHIFIDKEYILMQNPKNIFLDTAGWGIVQQEFHKEKNLFKKLDGFKNGAYMLLSNTFYYINIDQMLANSFFIAKTIYPELYKDLDPAKKADEIFNAFVGQPLYKVIKADTGGFQKIILKEEQLVLESIE